MRAVAMKELSMG